MDRREFLKTAGVGAASLSGMASSVIATAAEFDVPRPQYVEHYVPENKHLDPMWVRGLYARGQKRIYSDKALDTIGMPVGGIGTGQLYLRGDGTLGIWQIFNHHHFTGVGEDSYKPRKPDSPVDQGFAVTVISRGKRMAATLDRTGFSEVEFNGEYPIGTVGYKDSTFPVEVEMQAFSPFIPLNAKDSALPATVFHITVENVSERTVRAGVVGWLQNAVCFHSAPHVRGRRRSRTFVQKGRTLLMHSTEDLPRDERGPVREPVVLMDFESDDYGDWTVTGEAFGDRPVAGTSPDQSEVKGYLGNGFVNTFHGADEAQGTLSSTPFTISRHYVNFLVGGGDHAGETCINLLVDGEVVRSTTGNNKEELRWHSWYVEEFEGKEAKIEIVDRNSGSWGHILVDEIELADTRRQEPTGPLERFEDYGTLVLAYEDEATPPHKTQEIVDSISELRSKVEVVGDVSFPMGEQFTGGFHAPWRKLTPGEKYTFVFVLAWHFPNHAHGHEYDNRFANAAEVAHYVLQHHDQLAGQTQRWRDTYYDSTLPYWLLDRLHSTVSTLATGTCQWWKSCRFWAWEGVGCCGGTCTHVWNYAQAHARLFPELARSVREMQDFGEGFQPETGLVGFRSNDAYAADGQCGTILKAYREHQMSADNLFLERNWPKIKKALEYAIEQDQNGDGMIENSQHNTYDIEFYGANTFVGSLYLAALRAGEEMAKEMGDDEFAKQVQGIFKRGRRASGERLWDGEYFIQEVDLEEFPEHQYGKGCLSDQVFGEGWAWQLSLGSVYAEGYGKRALASIWTYNWAPDVGPQNAHHKPRRYFAEPGEAGLFVCTWPKTPHLDEGVVYQNEVWTGIEYQVAAHMIWEGLIQEGLAMLRAIDDRYHPLKRNPWNEVECGDHYARALASWGVLLALSGYEYHGPKGHLGFAPRMTPEDFRVAFTTAEGWGTFSQTRKDKTQRNLIQVKWGRLRLNTVALELSEGQQPERVAVWVSGEPANVESEFQKGRLVISFPDKVNLKEGEQIEVIVS